MNYYLAQVSFKRYYTNKEITVTELVYASNEEEAKELVYKEYEERYPIDEFDWTRDIEGLYVSIQKTIGFLI